MNFFGPRSEYIISGSDCGYVYVWDKDSEAIVQWVKGDENIVSDDSGLRCYFNGLFHSVFGMNTYIM